MTVTPLIKSLPATVPFVGPEALERRSGVAVRARLGANESVFGPSPKVIAAMQAAAGDAWKYGDPENYDLRCALAKRLGVEPQNIAIGEGIDGLQNLVVRLFVEAGDVAVTSLGAYPTFNYHLAGIGGRLVQVPYRNVHEDLDALIKVAAAEKAKLLFVVNPDNPMGSVWPASDVQQVIDCVPEGCTLLLDEAYIEMAPDGTAPPFDVSARNVLRFRTMSKAYGLAGLRVGYVIGHADVISAFDKIRNHFGVTRISQAGAMAALDDEAWVIETKSRVEIARKRISEIAIANGLKPLPSATNFVTIDCGRDGAYAKGIVDGLLHYGVFIRMPGAAPLNRCIRVSCGTASDLDILAEALPKVLALNRGER